MACSLAGYCCHDVSMLGVCLARANYGKQYREAIATAPIAYPNRAMKKDFLHRTLTAKRRHHTAHAMQLAIHHGIQRTVCSWRVEPQCRVCEELRLDVFRR